MIRFIRDLLKKHRLYDKYSEYYVFKLIKTAVPKVGDWYFDEDSNTFVKAITDHQYPKRTQIYKMYMLKGNEKI